MSPKHLRSLADAVQRKLDAGYVWVTGPLGRRYLRPPSPDPRGELASYLRRVGGKS